jgi:hypothetical protein
MTATLNREHLAGFFYRKHVQGGRQFGYARDLLMSDILAILDQDDSPPTREVLTPI